ncbi:GNVR domain-containing protein [Thiohalobacter sp. IOR34]|uniref:XrtA system polysaccharide chain length determinant n=1 Tax=Thiohalobacter sp. IOR34 TaxID=3057176 RepID=UPI0025B19AE8|nr:XrtA system polysaccharide chain length determinant [Thiohalobacter sp. IOR34]WJW74466.1 GNVR domain-containing protein [Thiohalobacter sp. IOR34]
MILTAWAVSLGGWAFVYSLPDQYQATAMVHVDTQTVLRPLLRGLAVNFNATQRIGMMTRTLITRPNLEKLARMTDLDLQAGTPEQMEDLLDSLARRIKLHSTKRENLYTISFTDPDRKLAKRVVQSLLTIFVESSLGQSREDTDTAQQFLAQQISQYEKKLNEAEARLADFKRRHVGMMPGEGRDYYARLQNAQSELDAARLQLRELENRRAAQLRQMEDLEDEESTLGIYSDSGGATSAIDARIQSLQSRLDELLLKFTDRHPDVIELRRLIETLETQRQEEAEAMPAEATQSGNPLYQQMQMMLTETTAQIASMRARVAEYESRVKKLQELVDTVPRVEAELQRLNRDYAVHKKNYEQLLARREQANISEQAEISADDVKFRVVEPPRVPLTPSGPNRPLLMSIVMLVGLGSGVFLAYLLYQMRPTFDDPKVMKQVTGLPVFGTVSMVYTDEILRKRRLAMLSFSIVGIGLLLFYAGVMVADGLDLNLAHGLRGLLKDIG